MKIITPEEDESVAEFVLEITILRKCKHVNITAHHGSWYKGDELFVSRALCLCDDVDVAALRVCRSRGRRFADSHLCASGSVFDRASGCAPRSPQRRSSWSSATAALWATFRLVRLLAALRAARRLGVAAPHARRSPFANVFSRVCVCRARARRHRSSVHRRRRSCFSLVHRRHHEALLTTFDVDRLPLGFLSFAALGKGLKEVEIAQVMLGTMRVRSPRLCRRSWRTSANARRRVSSTCTIWASFIATSRAPTFCSTAKAT